VSIEAKSSVKSIIREMS